MRSALAGLLGLVLTALIWVGAIVAYKTGIIEGRHLAAMEQTASSVQRQWKGDRR